jgi:Methyltransferase domain
MGTTPLRVNLDQRPRQPGYADITTSTAGPSTYMTTALLLLSCLLASHGSAVAVTSRKPVETRLPPALSTRQTDHSQRNVAPKVKSGPQPQKGKKPLRKPDVIYYPTPDETVTEMLRMAEIKPGDVLYDLGSGDGRIPIMAAKQYGIRAVGIEIDPKLITVAEERAREANVARLVSFRNADMFHTNISEATVVTLYLSNKLNLLLRPKLLRELRPGSRILSHDFHMGDWEAERSIRVPWQNGLYRTIYFWRVPAHHMKARAKTAR